MPTDKPFRFAAQRAFLTYPNSDGGTTGDRAHLTKERLLDVLRDRMGATLYRIALEQHKSGRMHLHAYVDFGRTIDTRNVRYFDVDGYHPNVGSVRDIRASLIYLEKGGDYIGNIETPARVTDVYAEALAIATGPNEFLEELIRRDPRGVVHGLERIEYFSKWRWNKTQNVYESKFDIADFLLPAELKLYLEEEFIKVIPR